MFLNVLNEAAELGMGGNLDHVGATNNGYDGEAGAYQILFESAEEWNNLTMAMANLEAKAFLESNDLLLEAGVSGFVDAAKEFFTKAWKKIQELFNQFTTWLQSSISNDTKFLSKYGKKIDGIGAYISEDFKYNMMPVDLNALNSKLVAGVGAADTAVNGLVSALTDGKATYEGHGDAATKRSSKESVSDKADAVRGTFCGESSVAKGEFKKAFLDAVCGGDSSTREMAGNEIEWSDLKSIVKEAKTNIAGLKASRDKLSQTYAKIIKALERAKGKLGSGATGADKDSAVNLKFKQAGGFKGKKGGFDSYSGNTTDSSYSFGTQKNSDINSGKDWTDEQRGKTNTARATNMSTSISNAITQIKAVSEVCTEAYGVAISTVKKARAQARGCLTKALTQSVKGPKVENESMAYENILEMFM